MSGKNIIKYLICLVGITSLLTACEKTEGEMATVEALGFKKCETTTDCGFGSFCNDDSFCTSECSLNRDCYNKDKDVQEAWQKAKDEGKAIEDADLPPLKYKCSECGSCIPIEQEKDDRCAKTSTTLCKDDKECSDYGANYVCGSDGYCTLTCKKSEDCGPMDRGHVCGDDPKQNRKVCHKYCYDDSTCAFHGFTWRCSLPDGVDKDKNFFSRDSVVGRCVPGDEVDYGEHVDEEKDTHKLVGIYGAINNSTFTNCGFPIVNCQDTVNIHHLLFRVRQTENGIELDGKYCYHEAMNFKVKEGNKTMDKISTDNELAWMEVPERYTMAVAYHHWTAEPASYSVGDSFKTSNYLEIRGALLDDPKNDDLPTKDNLDDAWDQDRDGKPGVTTVMNGILSGEIYNVNRADQFGVFEIAQLGEKDRVEKIKGLLTTENESGILGATNPAYAVEIKPYLYEDADRSYMRFMRLPDDASCLDVFKLGKSEQNCPADYNSIRIKVDDNDTYLCHVPTVDGPQTTE